MITKRGQHIHLLDRMSGVAPPNVTVTPLARNALILTNTHTFTFTKCRLQVQLLERSLVATSRRVLGTS